MKTTAKDLRIHARRILEAVERGQEVTVTHRGAARAKIVPIRGRRRVRARELPAFGMWKDHAGTKDVAGYVRRLRRRRS